MSMTRKAASLPVPSRDSAYPNRKRHGYGADGQEDAMQWRVLAVAACVWIAGCAREPQGPVSFGPDAEAIIAAESEFNEASAARDVERLMALYHSSAMMISPNGQWMSPGDIRRYYEAMAADPSARLTVDHASVTQVAATDGLAYSAGGYSEIHAASEIGQVRISDGQAVRVWRREDGAWRIVVETRTPQSVRVN
jgi:ketosteroid isomerase-like protein